MVLNTNVGNFEIIEGFLKHVKGIYHCRMIATMSSSHVTYLGNRPPLWPRDNIVSSHLADPGLISRRVNFLGWGFTGLFHELWQMSGKRRPHPYLDNTGHHHKKSFITGTNDHWCWRALITSLSLSPSLPLSVSLSLCFSLYSRCLSLCFSLCLYLCLSICLPLCLSLALVALSVSLSLSLSLALSVSFALSLSFTVCYVDWVFWYKEPMVSGDLLQSNVYHSNNTQVISPRRPCVPYIKILSQYTWTTYESLLVDFLFIQYRCIGT